MSVGRNGTSTINTGAATTTFISAESFTQLANPQINDVLQRAADVTIQHMGSQADTTVIIGGAQPYETQVLIDGHPLALGQYGVWTSQFFPSFIVGGAEIQSGPGNTTPFANIAVGGTLNLLTPGFTPNTTAEVTTGFDSYNSQNTNFLTTGSIDKLGYVVGIGQASTNGYFQGKSGCVVSPDNYGAGDNQPGNTGIVQYCGSLAGPLFVDGDILKLRYAFTPSTSLELGFVGAWAQFDPQGAAWGNSVGAITIEGCQTAVAFACTNPANANLIGKTIQGYVEYPGSSVYNNQDLFDGQFRTALPGNNTLLVRPYIGSIQPEIIDGSEEGAYPAFFGPLPGTANYTAPTYANGKVIPPSFQPGGTVGTPLEQYCGVSSNVFGYSQLQDLNGKSSVVNGQQQCFQYPYSSYEQDKLYGTTFSFLHPFGDSLLNLTYDFHGQSDFAYFNGPANVSVPLSSNRYSTISLTGYLHLIRNVGFNVGLYDTRWTVAGVKPKLDATGDPVIDPATTEPFLTGLGRGVSRFDPHFAVTFRPTSDVSYRASAGSSATFPYLGQVSGNAAFQPYASSNPFFTAGILTEKNPNLDPEVSIAYGVGVDKRFHGGSILSFDLQDTVIHNVFETLVQNETTPAGILGVSDQINVARLHSELAPLKYVVAPRYGLGFNVAVAAERSIIDGIPGAAGIPANGVQICGDGLATPGIPTCIPYLKGYGQITYANLDGSFAEIGVDYEGKNNSYFQPPFAQVDASFTTPLTKHVEFILGVQNLLNTNSYEHLPAPGAGVPLVSDDGKGQGSYISTLIPAPPRTLHAQIRLHVGR
ncbi:MAG: TonB-dependent receptor [Candidatus Eremiobacteraeota bacterium]|nr:TonB-dependent receptor [Candidatus Eremiobacteraeota bacterium]